MPICLQLTSLSQGAVWKLAFAGAEGSTVKWGEERGEDRRRRGVHLPLRWPWQQALGLLTGSRCWMCCRVTHSSTHTRIQARYLPPALHFSLTSGHNWPLTPSPIKCCTSQMIGRFWALPESPLEVSVSRLCILITVITFQTITIFQCRINPIPTSNP